MLGKKIEGVDLVHAGQTQPVPAQTTSSVIPQTQPQTPITATSSPIAFDITALLDAQPVHADQTQPVPAQTTSPVIAKSCFQIEIERSLESSCNVNLREKVIAFWEKFLLFLCMVCLAFDMLFMLTPVVDGRRFCLTTDIHLFLAFCVIEKFLDIFYMLPLFIVLIPSGGLFGALQPTYIQCFLSRYPHPSQTSKSLQWCI
ncbi:hypothetical protein DY000_02046308 [Brassica cretica]|uniref:Uncharacterized protein n=1 Tax=Brassica cretica TaxID=69181 RepID=A0ABQ7EPF6_BRACR|nr:hypothetical protein DY000_02046308 [Brassica cretica]